MMEDVSLFEDRVLANKDVYYREFVAWLIACSVLMQHEDSEVTYGFVCNDKQHIAVDYEDARHFLDRKQLQHFAAFFVVQFREVRAVPTYPWEFSEHCDLWASTDPRCLQHAVNYRDFDIAASYTVRLHNLVSRLCGTNYCIPLFKDFCPFRYELHKNGILDEFAADVKAMYRIPTIC